MVGYDEGDTLTSYQKFIAGCIAGGLTRFITQPLDVVKLKVQLEKPDHTRVTGRFFKYTRHILKEEGLYALLRGHGAGQIHSILSLSTQFYIYEQTTKLASQIKFEHKNKHVMNFSCGLIAGCLSSILTVPLEVIRVHQIVFKDPRYNGIVKGGKEVYKRGGIFAFYEGFGASCLQLGPAAGISFAVFNMIQPIILNLTQSCGDTCLVLTGLKGAAYVIISSGCAGFVAGVVSKTATYPMDLVKRRMQIRAHASRTVSSPTLPQMQNLIKCDSIIQCFKKSYKKDGVRGLFRGFKVTMLKAQLQAITSFTVYELVCYIIRDRDNTNSGKNDPKDTGKEDDPKGNIKEEDSKDSVKEYDHKDSAKEDDPKYIHKKDDCKDGAKDEDSKYSGKEDEQLSNKD